KTLLRGEPPVFVMEMPLYKWPSWRTVGHRMYESGWMFVRRAGTFILATMIVVWALLYFPATMPDGGSYDETIAQLKEENGGKKKALDRIEKKKKDVSRQAELKEEIEEGEDKINQLQSDWTGQSYLGEMGKAIEPVVEPLGWDWRIGMAAIASFPAREVMV